LALIRDGATLARNPDDVLEALGRLALVPPAVPAAAQRDAAAAALLTALESGATDFDDLVGASGISAANALAALTLLELEGAIESCGGTRYARVAPASRGEDAAR